MKGQRSKDMKLDSKVPIRLCLHKNNFILNLTFQFNTNINDLDLPKMREGTKE
jgi:hypothetical protein